MANSSDIGLTIVRNIQRVIQDNAEALTRLDAAIGDGDHGTNMARGFNAAMARLEQQADRSLGAVLKTVATTLISTVGGAAGPLYGTAFLRAATSLDGKTDVAPADVLAAFDAAVEGVKQRGKATTGEKTMVDALEPAREALRSALEGGLDLTSALQQAADAARTGMEATIPMQATKG
ncbi:MAG: dihydroxyacetone kinase subunit L, partial [Thermomicrobiaceae bacterium]|nr:dihydroxyacetone kinase subunit L [Thermomicrobiaceae bacterium]